MFTLNICPYCSVLGCPSFLGYRLPQFACIFFFTASFSARTARRLYVPPPWTPSSARDSFRRRTDFPFPRRTASRGVRSYTQPCLYLSFFIYFFVCRCAHFCTAYGTARYREFRETAALPDRSSFLFSFAFFFYQTSLRTERATVPTRRTDVGENRRDRILRKKLLDVSLSHEGLERWLSHVMPLPRNIGASVSDALAP